MKIFHISGQTRKSKILIGESLQNLKHYLPETKVIVVTDTNLRKLYGKHFPDCPVIEIGVGEKIKNLQTIEYIIEKLIAYNADRTSFIVGIGGGIVCDITGFAASVFMRGIGFGFVSTSLLSQVDASVGGKNGVNFSGFKNIIGVFNQPEFVICDMEMLKTLPKKEISCGFAEIVKHALIADAEMFEFLENNYADALALKPQIIEKLVHNSVEIKSEIVNKDEQEKGERKKLNFGHTYGHAIEKTSQITHGEAVSLGMIAASELSVQKGMLERKDAERIKQLLANFQLPIDLNFDKNKVANALQKDKKRNHSQISFVLLQKIGQALVEAIEMEKLKTRCRAL